VAPAAPHRRIAQPAFHRERIAGFAEKMSDAVSQMLRQWDRQGVDGQAIDVAERMTMLTQEIVAATLFGSEVSSADATRFA
jgi:cytochrome P450